jgi:hypothetical protein
MIRLTLSPGASVALGTLGAGRLKRFLLSAPAGAGALGMGGSGSASAASCGVSDAQAGAAVSSRGAEDKRSRLEMAEHAVLVRPPHRRPHDSGLPLLSMLVLL